MENVLLFGSSDLLQVHPEVYAFNVAGVAGGRTANWYLAAAMGRIHGDEKPRLFRALSFFRLQRPSYEPLTLDELDALSKRFAEICQRRDVACRVLLGYGWADLYLDLAADRLRSLFSVIIGCRGVVLQNRIPVFRNAFTIVGVDMRRERDIAAVDEVVIPSIALRVAPSRLRNVVQTLLPKHFPAGLWRTRITSGKRDIIVSPKNPLPFGEFWKIHRRLRRRIGLPNSPVHKIETHFDFDHNDVLQDLPVTGSTGIRCGCSDDGNELKRQFVEVLSSCVSLPPGLKASFHGLAELYREALEDRDSCCDFDAAAAHFYAQRTLFAEYDDLSRLVREFDAKQELTESEAAQVIATRRRHALIRDVLERLEISAGLIFQQEQNGSYVDLLSRSERVALYRGGMQKINSVLLSVTDQLIASHSLATRPMICWWPAGQIQSERPIAVIKVPVFFLHQPEVALFLIIHELGQLSAYEHFKERAEKRTQSEYAGNFGPEFVSFLGTCKVKDPTKFTSDAPEQNVIEFVESRGVDTGKLITDVWADVFLLRIGFGGNLKAFRNFVFEQLLKFEHAAEPMSRTGTIHILNFVARLVSVTVADLVFREIDHADEARQAPKLCVITPRHVANAQFATWHYVHDAVKTPRFASLIDGLPGVVTVLTDDATAETAGSWAWDNRIWLAKAIAAFRRYRWDDRGDLDGLSEVLAGRLATIDPSRITHYFRELLNVEDRSDDGRKLFRARAALIFSFLAARDRQPRLPRQNNIAAT